MLIYLNGLMLGLSLITTLGPQNIFLIRQGAMRNHAVLSAITCFICDLLLVTGSVIGLHGLLETYPPLKMMMTWFGALFLMYYGTAALKRGLLKHGQRIDGSSRMARKKIIVLALGFSLLNPHAIIDSLVLIGGGSAQFPGHESVFLLGVLSSSLLWFTLLTLTTYYFSAGLSRPGVWRLVECCGGVLMILLGFKLSYSQL